jgi:hypothetical protein
VSEHVSVGAPGVAALAADPAWRVTMLSGGRWSVAERAFEHAGCRWLIGLTPATSAVALIVWRDDEVVAHARGGEAAMCAAAAEWVTKILAAA